MMNEEDKAIWAAFVKTVVPLKAKPKGLFERVRYIFHRPPSIQKLPDCLDLHGYTLQEAFDAFRDFLDRHYLLGTKKITIVTGKGPKEQGAVKREFPLWLERDGIREKILNAGLAPVNRGGSGAMILYLKKAKR